jgi:hypothetical protein
MTNILFKLERNGLINQLMSFEIAVLLSNQLKKNILIHNISSEIDLPISSNWVNTYNRNFIKDQQHPRLIDIIEYDTSVNVFFADSLIENKNNFLVIDKLRNYYFNNTNIKDNDFSYGRQNLFDFIDKSLYIQDTNVWYSVFFLNKDKDFYKTLKLIKFKDEYINLAKKISKSLEFFNGMHVRLTDHQFWMTPLTMEKLNDYTEQLESNLKLVVATDDSENIVFKKIKDKVIFLDKYIVENFLQEFNSLEFHDESIFGLITNLVMHDSVDFIGSPGSTYSGYIQRNIYQKNNNYKWKIFEENQSDEGKPYSFSNYYPEDLRSWWREWKESFINE